MAGTDTSSDQPLKSLLARLNSAPGPGAPGIILAPTGVGKTALLAHVAIDALQQERKVLHVSLRDGVDHVRAHYDEVFRVAAQLPESDRASALVALERHRMILSYKGQEFSMEALSAQVEMLRGIAHFEPTMVMLDGLSAAAFEVHGAAIRQFSEASGLPCWVSVSSDEPLSASYGAAFVLGLDGSGGLQLAVGEAEAEALSLHLDATTGALVADGHVAQGAQGSGLLPEACTLYAGGASGAEEAFGEVAAKYGLTEVNFTFDGHRQSRTVGQKVLSSTELEAGDVSLVYVSRRLHRNYSEKGLIRKVLQALWHMVSRSGQIFVIGSIQEDGTVVGGTGWSVELAKMWSKEVWVFDQDRDGWFTWSEDAWVEGKASIGSAYICGTGTRYLKPNGRAAIEALFAESFSG